MNAGSKRDRQRSDRERLRWVVFVELQYPAIERRLFTLVGERERRSVKCASCTGRNPEVDRFSKRGGSVLQGIAKCRDIEQVVQMSVRDHDTIKHTRIDVFLELWNDP